MHRLERVGWPVVALLLVTFAIPWFLWGEETVLAGLPIWLWWHVGWLLLTSVVFWVFTRRAWGLGIEPDFGDEPAPAFGDEPEDRRSGGGDRP